MARTYDLHVLFSQEELDMIHWKMANMGIKNRSAFLRKMALDGYIVNLDMDDIHEMIRLLRNTTNNLNQIAKKLTQTEQFTALKSVPCWKSRMRYGRL